MCRQQSWVIVHPPDDSRTAVFAEWPESEYWHWVCDGLLTINALGCEQSEELADEQRIPPSRGTKENLFRGRGRYPLRWIGLGL